MITDEDIETLCALGEEHTGLREEYSELVLTLLSRARGAEEKLAGIVRGKSRAARHSKATPRWGTPDGDPKKGQDYLPRIRRALGGEIDLDPMSEAVFNETVRAARIYTEQDDCFKHPWVAERLLINPAGGLIVEAWRKLMDEVAAGNTVRAVWVGFSVEQLGLLADQPWHPDDFSKLTPRKRIGFTRHDGFRGSPGHANYVIGIGIPHEEFEAAFAGLGKITRGQYSV